ncbi:energy-coupling factor ABC transporter ATP-binding protein [Salinarimonas ramus]|uniref:ABC transporter domain-containing protein n=1 Tax=Salinarimonas ramus TaxID=690164 RepID=A0A917V261_9HYPH|nr:energy-coupling factor ABC transporter ATP-binding protein [Salinarimonas ramus]GGK21207.1 hypothetical protein GCM10011322_04830 [Salinarimonas ramus]
MICKIRRLRASVDECAIFDLSAVELPGRCCFIYGPSGIGKSTFLKGLASGNADAECDGVSFRKLIEFGEAIRTIRYVPQHPPRFDFGVQTFLRNILKSNRNVVGCESTLETVVREFDLEPLMRTRMTRLSGGQLQRVHLAAALASNAELLLLDEPTAALDRRNGEILTRLLREYVSDRGGHIVCCTHDTLLGSLCEYDHRFHAIEFPSFLPMPIANEDKVYNV